MENKLKPSIYDDSKPFWEGLKKKKLLLQHCNDCQKYIFYPRQLCPHCFSENIEWVESSGEGVIHSYTVVHRPLPQFKDEAPYVVGLIELKEGVRMISRIIGSREEISIGESVTVVYKNIDDDLVLPYFQLK